MGSEAVWDRRLKYAASLSPASCSRKAGLAFNGDDDDDDDDDDDCLNGFHAYIIVQEEACVEADADWIPDRRGRDDNRENASTLPLLILSAAATKSTNTRDDDDDDEGAEIGLMLMVMVMIDAMIFNPVARGVSNDDDGFVLC
jgi:hypothetical protein